MSYWRRVIRRMGVNWGMKRRKRRDRIKGRNIMIVECVKRVSDGV